MKNKNKYTKDKKFLESETKVIPDDSTYKVYVEGESILYSWS